MPTTPPQNSERLVITSWLLPVVRALSACALVGYLIVGLVVRVVDAQIVDPWSLRFAPVGFLVVHLSLTFTPWGRRQLNWLNFAVVQLMNVHALVFVWISNGSMAACAALAMLAGMQIVVLPYLFGDIFRRLAGSAVLVLGMLVVGLALPESQTPVVLLLGGSVLVACMFAVGHVVQSVQEWTTQRDALRLQSALSASNAVLFTLDAAGKLTHVHGSELRLLDQTEATSIVELGRQAVGAFPELPQMVASALQGNPAEADMVRGHSAYHFALRPMPPGNADRVVGIVTDVTSLKRSEADLRRAQTRALQASQAKSRFVANMSHELRTPLNGVVGMASLLGTTGLDSEQREYVDALLRSGRTLRELIDEILDFSKIEAGEMTVEWVPVDVRDLVSGVVELLGAKARVKGLLLVADVAPDVPREVIGDPTRLRQVLTNLVGNAVKFTSMGEVVLSVDLGGAGRLLFEVRDTGIGIKKEAFGRLFEPFTQADGSTTRQFGGSGLGLAISRRLVELMSGCMEVESVRGEGSTFTVILPWEVVPSERAGISLAGMPVQVVHPNDAGRRMLLRCVQRWGGRVVETPVEGCLRMVASTLFRGELDHPTLLIADGPSQQTITDLDDVAWVRAPLRETALSAALGELLRSAEVVRRAETTKPTDQTARILLVEDNKVNQLVAARLLEKAGHDVRTAPDGREALAELRQHRFDLVLMDCQMPVMDGFQATRAIRALSSDVAQIPVIALTANALVEDRQRCLDSGMDDYLTKPLDPDALFSIVRNVMNAA